jgi:hypothetical protein
MSPEMYEKVMAGIWGFVIGAVAAMTIGFVWGGWTTSSTTKKMSEEAVLSSHAAICVAQFVSAANYKANIKELQAMDTYRRSEFIEKGGWDRMPGEEKSAWGVSTACAAGLEPLIKPET